MILKRITAFAAASTFIGGCASSATHPQDGSATTDTRNSSVITGTLRETGGPPPGTPRPVSATVTVGDYAEKTSDDGVYRIVVSAGTYTVSMKFGNADCQSSSISVKDHETVTVDLACSVK